MNFTNCPNFVKLYQYTCPVIPTFYLVHVTINVVNDAREQDA